MPIFNHAAHCGSWRASFRSCACIGTMNHDEAAAGALASWTAAVLCRFCACGPELKALEDWRTPKPGGTAAGSWKASFRFCAYIGTMNLKCISPSKSTTSFFGSWKVPFRFRARIGTMNPLATLPRRGTDRARTNACSPPGRGWGWVGSWRARPKGG